MASPRPHPHPNPFRIERPYCGNECHMGAAEKNASLVSRRENVCKDMCIGMFGIGAGRCVAWVCRGEAGRTKRGNTSRTEVEGDMGIEDGVVRQINGKARCALLTALQLTHRDSAILEGCGSFHQKTRYNPNSTKRHSSLSGVTM